MCLMELPDLATGTEVGKSKNSNQEPTRKAATKTKVKPVAKASSSANVSKNRFGFNIAKDVALLQAALSANLWQLGQEKWAAVSSDLSEKFGYLLSERTVKESLNLLIKKFQTEDLSTKTGTEEQKSERGELLENIIFLIEEDKASININLGADEDSNLFTSSEVEACLPAENNEPALKKKTDPNGRIAADKERDAALAAMLMDHAPEASGIRRKRSKMSIEEEMIKTKQQHDMDIEKRRLLLEEKRQARELDIEEKKLDLERNKMELDEKRERRLEAESIRRDEIAITQLQFQNDLLKLTLNLSSK